MMAILHSGGLDSTAVLLWYKKKKKKIQPLFIDYGQKAAKAEYKASKSCCSVLNINKPLRIKAKLTIPNYHHVMINNAPSGKDFEDIFFHEFFPNRNTYLLSLASMYCVNNHIHEMALGIINGGDYGYTDTNGVFLKKINHLFNYTVNIAIKAPLIDWTKNEIIKFLMKENFPLDKTYSCNTANTPCHHCAACMERASSF